MRSIPRESFNDLGNDPELLEAFDILRQFPTKVPDREMSVDRVAALAVLRAALDQAETSLQDVDLYFDLSREDKATAHRSQPSNIPNRSGGYLGHIEKRRRGV
jgi:hypothetical protein